MNRQDQPTYWTVRRVKALVRRHVVGIQTPSGRLFDLVFIVAVFVGVIALILEEVPEVIENYQTAVRLTEAVVGTMFILEYCARVWVARRRLRYMFSFWGLIDLVAILPFVFQGFGLAYLRVLRILRIFAIFKVTKYTSASNVLSRSLLESRSKIAVFLLAVCVMVCVIGFTMHAIEPETFPTAPEAMWWTVVTITTVGYGDYVPVTVLGKLVAGVSMVMAFGILAVPTGIVAVEYGQALRGHGLSKLVLCSRCFRKDHEQRANYCSTCGEKLPTRKLPIDTQG